MPATLTPDTEWEWEYDQEETEDIYFTLDLTTHVADAVGEKEHAKNGKRLRISAAERQAAAERRLAKWKAREKLAAQKGGEAIDDGLDRLDGRDSPTPDARDAAADLSNAQDKEISKPGRLQLLGLHTENPYVKYNNGFYSCHWHTDLGTQLWVSRPGLVENPRMSGHILDIIASSQARLVGKPATLKRKRGVQDADYSARSLREADEDMLGVGYEPENPDEPLVIKRTGLNDPHMQGQADFMERLSAIKIKRGERDAQKVPLKMPVYYKGAVNAEELREQALAQADDELIEQELSRGFSAGNRGNGNRGGGRGRGRGRGVKQPSRSSEVHEEAEADTSQGEEANNDSDPDADYDPGAAKTPRATPARRQRGKTGGAVSRQFLRESLGLPRTSGISGVQIPKRRSYVHSGKYGKARITDQAEAASNAGPSQSPDVEFRSPSAPQETPSAIAGAEARPPDSAASPSVADEHSFSPDVSATPAPSTPNVPENPHRRPGARKPRRTRAEMDAEKAAKYAKQLEKPRKRRRTKEEMAAARAEEARQKEAKAAARANAATEKTPKEKPVRLPTGAGTFETDAQGNLVTGDPAARRRQTRQAREFGRQQEEAARRALLGPVQGGLEMVLRFDEEPTGGQQGEGSGQPGAPGGGFALDPLLMQRGAGERDEGEGEDPLADLERAGGDEGEADD